MDSTLKRRMPRFRLQTLLVLLALFGVIFALIGRELHRTDRQRQAASHVQRQGGQVRSVAEAQKGAGLVSGLLRHFLGDAYFADVLSVNWCPRSEEDLDLLHAFPKLAALNLEGNAVTDVALEKLTGFPKLYELSLDDAVIGGSGLKSLTELPNLRSVSFQNCPLSNGSLRALAQLPNIRSMTFQDCGLSDDSLKALHTAPSLTELRLSEPGVTEAGVLAIRDAMPVLNVHVGHSDIVHTARWIALFGKSGFVTSRRDSSAQPVSFINTYDTWDATRQVGVGGIERGSSYLPSVRQLPVIQWLRFRGPFTSDATLEVLKDARGLTSLVIERCRVTDNGLANLHGLTQLTRLDLVGSKAAVDVLSQVRRVPGFSNLARSDCQITDRGLKLISNLSGLTNLTVFDCQVTDQGLQSVGRLVNLTHLALNGDQITDAGMRYLRPLRRLTELGLGGTAITDEGLRELDGLTELRVFVLRNTKIQGHGLGSLPPGITRLDLDHANVTDGGLAAVARLTSLENLSLRGTRVTDDGVGQLARMTSLRYLDLNGTQVTDRSIEALGELPLRYLDVADTKITRSGVERLRIRFPDANINGMVGTRAARRR